MDARGQARHDAQTGLGRSEAAAAAAERAAAAGSLGEDRGSVSMAVTEAGGELSASVAETNRVRKLLGLAPLAGTAAAEGENTAEPDGRVGPQLPMGGVAPKAGAVEPGQAAKKRAGSGGQRLGEGADAVLALTLGHFTSARPIWR